MISTQSQLPCIRYTTYLLVIFLAGCFGNYGADLRHDVPFNTTEVLPNELALSCLKSNDVTATETHIELRHIGLAVEKNMMGEYGTVTKTFYNPYLYHSVWFCLYRLEIPKSYGSYGIEIRNGPIRGRTRLRAGAWADYYFTSRQDAIKVATSLIMLGANYSGTPK